MWLARLFSPRVEESFRLRFLALASLWLGALGLVWVGSSLWLPLLGGCLGTVGYWLGWRWRHRRSLARSLLIACLVVAISILMRSQMMAVFNGNWMPVGNFLVLVQALSSFDCRTRGGLYVGLVLSGTVLFFASQQAFQPSFGIFIVGYVVVLLAFLTLSFLEDGFRGARVHWQHHRPGRPAMLPYWLGISTAVFIMSGLAFWLMPQGELSFLGPPQVVVLPYSGDSLQDDDRYADVGSVPIFNAGGLAGTQDSGQSGETPAQLGQRMASPVDGSQAGAPGAHRQHDGTGDGFRRVERTVFGAEADENSSGATVFYVRSKVSSYWRGRTLEHFDGRRWQTNGVSVALVPSTTRKGLWFNREALGRHSPTFYSQTFHVRRDFSDAIFMGYQALSVSSENGSIDGLSVREGSSYRVLSAYPQHNTDRLHRDSTWVASSHLTKLPPESERALGLLAERITDGAPTDFGKLERIVGYLSEQGTFDPSKSWTFVPTASLEAFLTSGRPGTAMDHATATVMLARASGMPSRLAVGYLPGIRDPLSGAFKVSQSDAHAWAEVYFADHGWVPFDSAPLRASAITSRSNLGAGRWIWGGAGDRVFGSVKPASSELLGPLLGYLQNPVFWIAGPTLLLGGLLLRWVYWRPQRRGPARPVPVKYSAILPGEGRRELLKLYRQAERLLKGISGVRRKPWQTVGDYTSLGPAVDEPVQSQITWFARVAWHAAYDPRSIPSGLIEEARRRLPRLKAALKPIGKITPTS